MTEIGGAVEPGFEAVADAFRANFEQHGEVGAATAVYVGGRKVVDLWGGVADVDAGTPYTEDSLQLVFSTTKGATAACANLLAQRGELDIDAPVAEYWPEFKAAGKADIPVRWLLCHKAGLPYVDAVLTLEEALAWDPMIRALEVAGARLGARHRARLPRHHLRLAGRRGRAAHLRQEPRHVLPRRDRGAARPRVLDRAPRRAPAPRGPADPVGRLRRHGGRGPGPGHGRADRAVHRPRLAARQGARGAQRRALRRRGRVQQPGRPRRRDPRRQRRHQRPFPGPLLRRAHRHRGGRPVGADPHRRTRSPRPRSSRPSGPDKCLMFETHLRARVLVGVAVRALRRVRGPSGTPAPAARWASPTRSTASASAT